MSLIDFLKNNTIVLSSSKFAPKLEGYSPSVVTPGMLLVLRQDGQYDPHNVANSGSEKMFAVENVYKGGTIYDDYLAGNRIMIRFFRPGDSGVCLVAAGQTLTIGNTLVSAGDGTLKKSTPPIPGGALVGVVLETLVTTELTRVIFRSA